MTDEEYGRMIDDIRHSSSWVTEFVIHVTELYEFDLTEEQILGLLQMSNDYCSIIIRDDAPNFLNKIKGFDTPVNDYFRYYYEKYKLLLE